MAFSHIIERSGGLVRVTMAGEADFAAAEKLRDTLADALREHPERVEVDLSALEFIDSRSAGALVGACQAAAGFGCQMVVNNPRGRVLHVLQTMGVLDALTGGTPRPPSGPRPRAPKRERGTS
ncbi:STAS domain-containing protein [Couchioplanes caeruleus]|uniref:STAS domain-containing protein n=2 Tax=Couchioplanes caeruleus TaxID=56438 RepID=A0A1K0GK32_9ACTN|nr:STAS domain-containing protein [Couchioplanes caeruleus]OJF12630.1 hypothetical protein BG844_19540 [Couchioplanes caeruleus subsp. caeruleus]ROP28416.1 anti-anti-sigma factor [Couchioplanes caeruleus]